MTIDKNYTLHIKGFKTKSQLMEFIAWYEGQGEQDSSIWFEEAKQNGKIGVSSMFMNMTKGTHVENDDVTIWIDPK